MSIGQKVKPQQYRWTAKQFFRLLDLNFFRNRRVELIEGVIVAMPAQKDFHLAAIHNGLKALEGAFGPTYWVRAQGSLALSPRSVPDPDLAVVEGGIKGRDLSVIPTTAILVIEVAETTLGYDRHRKASLYARFGIEDYWIVNVRRSQLEVRRQPAANAHPRYGHGYARLTTLGATDFVTPLAAPQAQIAVADLLP